MKEKIITILIIINLILLVTIYNLINKKNLNKPQQIIKEISKTEYEANIISLNKSHEEYANYIQTCKTQLATVLTNEGVATSNQDTLEKMADNISKVLQANSSDNYVDLGTGTTFDLTSYDGYENFTLDNFICEIELSNTTYLEQLVVEKDSYHIGSHAYIKLVKDYKDGILTVSYQLTTEGSGTGGYTGQSKTKIINARVYLLK